MKTILIRTVVSILAIAAVVLHLTHSVQFDWPALVLVAIASLPWLSEFIDTFKLGKDSVEVKLREIEKKADAAIDASLRGVIKSPITTLALPEAKSTVNDDPQNGLWGGNSTSNGRNISARIETIPGESLFRQVILRVQSIDSANPLTGNVTFHLHPTFNSPDYSEPVVDGVAETRFVSYGAFTVGAEMDDGKTKLELDLAKLDDQKDQFFKR